MRVGMTTTVPVEIILAAGHIPVDLNNIFITHADPQHYVEYAEQAGYPRNICGWIKGLYSIVVKEGNIDKVLAVTQGDCSNTHALMETLEVAGVETIPFAFPFDKDYDLLKLQMDKLVRSFGTDWDTVYEVKKRLDVIRAKVAEIDRRSWQSNTVSGFHNHLFQVSCSDFNGEPDQFERDVEQFLLETENASEFQEEIRLGYIGVPPIFTNLYEYVEQMGARVVYNEVQRQFAMPYLAEDIVEQYRLYTYPYGVFGRIEDIRLEIERRNLDGIIHYVQGFCYRQIEDLIVRDKLDVPILTIEGDSPGKIDARTRMRIDSFLEMLK